VNEPHWTRDALLLWWAEVRLFFSTLARFVTHPHRFGAQWANGEVRAMNPLGFLLSSWPILLPLDYGIQQWAGWDQRPSVGLTVEIARALRPYLFVLPMALLLYGFFRAADSRRRLTTTLGLLLYWSVLAIVGWIVGLLICWATPFGWWVPQTCSAITMIWGALALAGAHEVHWAWCLAAVLGTGAASVLSINDLLDSLHWS
jgi:hypothetical protein